MKEETNAVFKYGKNKYNLLRITTTEDKTVIRICNSVGGYRKYFADGTNEIIEDKIVESEAKKANLKKDNENHYYLENAPKPTPAIYMIVKNRRRLMTTPWEDTAKRKFANLIASELLQQKISF